MGIPGPFLILFVSFYKHLSVDNCSINVCKWLDSNPGPLVSEATVLSTVPQPLTAQITKLLIDLWQEREREEEVFISWLEGEGLWRRVVVVCLFVDDEDEAKHDHL